MRRIVAVLAMLLALCVCASQAAAAAVWSRPVGPGTAEPPAVPPEQTAAASADTPPYEAPAFHDAVFHPELAEQANGVQIDLSATAEGYVGVSATSDQRLKFQVVMGEDTYNYDLASDGTPAIFPLQCGNGVYRFRVMENVSESRYAELYSCQTEVTLHDEFQPFLRPSSYANYRADSACVKKAAELAADAHSQLEIVRAVYDFICANVKYDDIKAMSVQSGYLPAVDETLRSGRGICFDYAALAAAMLRSQGIPTKIIFGYVAPDGLYHAWNMFYTAETGWVTVSYAVSAKDWNRLDLTFIANGSNEQFVGDGSHYTDLYCY